MTTLLVISALMVGGVIGAVLTMLYILAAHEAYQTGSVLCEGTIGPCLNSHPDMRPVHKRTMYADGSDPQPYLCSDCTQEWDDMWDEMWAEYRSSQGV